ncbi:MAG: hypothetical protein N2515_02740 [Deltaproteobacteria bacterium]|nr:hypothetical protein [Deltaproteobacteria bacterium]
MRWPIERIAFKMAVLSGALFLWPLWSSAQKEERRFASSELSEAQILEAIANAHVDNLRPVGTTSIVFQLQLTGAIDAAFKPESRLHPRGWAHEIAAYRVARLLGMDQVPPARVRSLERTQMRRHLAPEWHGNWEALVGQIIFSSPRPGVFYTKGASIYWVPNLERSELDQPEARKNWSAWLKPGHPLEERERILARDLATMCLFDALIGNADRMSGGNLRTATNRGVRRVIIRDHDLAFPAHWSEPQRKRILGELRLAERFPRDLVEALRKADEAALRSATEDPEVGPLLTPEEFAALLDRRAMVLSYVAALIEMHGEEAVLDL